MRDRVTGWWVFAGIVLLISGTLHIIWGTALMATLMSIPADPVWWLCVFALPIIVVFELSGDVPATSIATSAPRVGRIEYSKSLESE